MAAEVISSMRGQKPSRGAEGELYISVFTPVDRDLKPERLS